MKESEIKAAIFASLAKFAPEADLSKLAPTANIRETLDIDSFDFLRLLIDLSKNLGVEIPEADYARVATLETMVAYLAKSATPPSDR